MPAAARALIVPNEGICAVTGRPLERFTQQEAESLGVVAQRGARRPPRRRLSHECTHVIPVAQLCVGDECAVLDHGGLEADLITVLDELVED